ncbi:MAG TPA: hypothetical protein VF476_12615 [Chitinophagaceae bacterium]
MSNQPQPTDSLKDIHDIRQIMERSSRFISLSGLSGIAAGVCALVASWFAYDWISEYYNRYNAIGHYEAEEFAKLKWNLMLMAGAVLVVALTSSFYFTWRKAKQDRQPIWNLAGRRLMWNMLVPLISGGLFILAMLQYNVWGFVAPACLIFYGLALVNASKYTVSDIRYLGYLEILLGLANMQYIGYGLYFWAFGFGVLHIVYGMMMWWKYERTN